MEQGVLDRMARMETKERPSIGSDATRANRRPKRKEDLSAVSLLARRYTSVVVYTLKSIRMGYDLSASIQRMDKPHPMRLSVCFTFKFKA